MEHIQAKEFVDENCTEPIDTIIKLNSTQADVTSDNISDKSSRVEAYTKLRGVEEMAVKNHYIESQVKDGASIKTKKQEHRNFRQMGCSHLWSKV